MSKVVLVTASYDLNFYLTPIGSQKEIQEPHFNKVQLGPAQINRIVQADQTKIAFCTNPAVIIYDTNGGKSVHYCGHQTNVTGIVFSGDKFYTCSEDRTIKAWTMGIGRMQASIGTGASLNGIELLPDGNTLATCNEKGVIELFDLRRPSEASSSLSLANTPVRSMAATKDGQKIVAVTHDGKGYFVRIENGSLTKELDFDAHAEIPLKVTISPDEKHFVTTGSDSKVKMWGMEKAESEGEFEAADMTKYVWDAAFTPDSRMLCTGGTDKIARVWDVETHEKIGQFEWHSKGVTALCVATF